MRALLVVVVALSLSTSAAADPTTRLALGGGVKVNLGELGDEVAPGYLIGVDAALHFGWFGFAWSLWRAAFRSSDARSTVDALETWQVDLGLRARARIPFGVPTYLFVQAGASILRASTPVPPEDSVAVFGPQLATGIEVSFGQMQIGVASGVGVLIGGPTAVDVRVTIGFGRVKP